MRLSGLNIAAIAVAIAWQARILHAAALPALSAHVLFLVPRATSSSSTTSTTTSTCTPLTCLVTKSVTATVTEFSTDIYTLTDATGPESTTDSVLARIWTWKSGNYTVYYATQTVTYTFLDHVSTTVPVCAPPFANLDIAQAVTAQERAKNAIQRLISPNIGSCGCVTTQTRTLTVARTTTTSYAEIDTTITSTPDNWIVPYTTLVTTGSTTYTYTDWRTQTKYKILTRISRTTLYEKAVTATLPPFSAGSAGTFKLRIVDAPLKSGLNNQYAIEDFRGYNNENDYDYYSGVPPASFSCLGLTADVVAASNMTISTGSNLIIPASGLTCGILSVKLYYPISPGYPYYDLGYQSWADCRPGDGYYDFYADAFAEQYCDVDCHGYLYCYYAKWDGLQYVWSPYTWIVENLPLFGQCLSLAESDPTPDPTKRSIQVKLKVVNV